MRHVTPPSGHKPIAVGKHLSQNQRLPFQILHLGSNDVITLLNLLKNRITFLTAIENPEKLHPFGTPLRGLLHIICTFYNGSPRLLYHPMTGILKRRHKYGIRRQPCYNLQRRRQRAADILHFAPTDAPSHRIAVEIFPICHPHNCVITAKLLYNASMHRRIHNRTPQWNIYSHNIPRRQTVRPHPMPYQSISLQHRCRIPRINNLGQIIIATVIQPQQTGLLHQIHLYRFRSLHRFLIAPFA